MKKSAFANRSLGAVTLAIAIGAFTTGTARAQYNPYWYDGFDTTAGSLDINFQIGAPRQGGAGIPTTWLSNGGAADYHDQLTSLQLLLAGDGSIANGIALASPNFNFSGLTGGGQAIGTKIEYVIDPGTINAAGRYTESAITIGSATPLVASQTAGANFSLRFVEDLFAGNGAFLQLADGNTLVGNLIPNPAGFGPMFVELFVSDTDGNPWDGIGGTKIDISINGTPTFSYTKGGGGYTANYITLEGSANFVGFGLETYFFDNVTVFSSPVPEPSAMALVGLGTAGLLLFRRRK
jgi:hypothetical protein